MWIVIRTNGGDFSDKQLLPDLTKRQEFQSFSNSKIQKTLGVNNSIGE